MDIKDALLALNSALAAALWWSFKSWMTKIDARLDKYDDRMRRQEKECVTREEFEDLKAEHYSTSSNMSSRLTVVETTCQQTHRK